MTELETNSSVQMSCSARCRNDDPSVVVIVVVSFIIGIKDSSSSVTIEPLMEDEGRTAATAHPFQNRLPAESGSEKADRAAAKSH
jgi:hypothetical protein